mmetsp:Transcript_39027/g.90811  ORF Transcript_39027/g.90811 Transcript_39027/m.90811 type:complete len:88 (-) Transcript_39027:635-898(-)
MLILWRVLGLLRVMMIMIQIEFLDNVRQNKLCLAIFFLSKYNIRTYIKSMNDSKIYFYHSMIVLIHYLNVFPHTLLVMFCLKQINFQ